MNLTNAKKKFKEISENKFHDTCDSPITEYGWYKDIESFIEDLYKEIADDLPVEERLKWEWEGKKQTTMEKIQQCNVNALVDGYNQHTKEIEEWYKELLT